MAVITNTTVENDVNPAITIDHVSRLTASLEALQRLMGIMDLKALAEGSTINQYTTAVGTIPAQVAEGDEIGLTKVSRTLANSFTITLKKYRKLVTAEAIQKSGFDRAINETDEALIREIRKGFKTDFYTALATNPTAGTNGATLQATCANLWASLQTKFEDTDATPIFFVNPEDVAEYLGSATITVQEAFGFNYMVNFLGMGDAIITPNVTKGNVYATAKENLNGAYVPANGDLGAAFGLTADESGIVGMTHAPVNDRASYETLIFMGLVFYAEDVSGVFKASIGATGDTGETGATGDTGVTEGA